MRNVKRPRKLAMIFVALAATLSVGTINTGTASADLCPTIVPGFGCSSIPSGTVLGGLDPWLQDLFNGANQGSGTVVHVPSWNSTRYRDCVETSMIPASGFMQLNHVDGTVVHLQRDNHKRQPTVKLWINGVENGEYYTPASFGNIHTHSSLRNVNEWFNGSFRRVTKVQAGVIACNGWSVA